MRRPALLLAVLVTELAFTCDSTTTFVMAMLELFLALARKRTNAEMLKCRRNVEIQNHAIRKINRCSINTLECECKKAKPHSDKREGIVDKVCQTHFGMAPKTRGNGAPAPAAMPALDEPDVEDLVQPPRKRDKAIKKEHGAVDTSSSSSGGVCMHSHSEAVHDFDMKALRDVRIHLLRWYDAHRRKLPWRGDPPPYLTTATHTKQTTAAGAASVAAAKKTKLGAMDAFVAVKVKSEDMMDLQDSATSADDQPQHEQSNDGHEASDDAPPRKVSPYETWVSEIMLQQTRVDTVVDYFVRWTDKFPTVDALARGSEEVRVSSVRRLTIISAHAHAHARSLPYALIIIH